MKPYQEIRNVLISKGIRQSDIAKKWGRSTPYVSDGFTNKRSLTLDEAYSLMEMAGLPANEIGKYFPKGGYNDISHLYSDEKECRKEVAIQMLEKAFALMGVSI